MNGNGACNGYAHIGVTQSGRKGGHTLGKIMDAQTQRYKQARFKKPAFLLRLLSFVPFDMMFFSHIIVGDEHID